jgi:hypothetical protein
MFMFNILECVKRMHLVEIEKKKFDWLTCSFCLLLGRSLDKGKLGLDVVVLKHPRKDSSFVIDFKQSLRLGKEVSTWNAMVTIHCILLFVSLHISLRHKCLLKTVGK